MSVVLDLSGSSSGDGLLDGGTGNDHLTLYYAGTGIGGGGDTAFTFQAGVFTGLAHQLHVVTSGGVQIVEADLNGDRAADMAIVVVSATALVIADFVL